MSSPTRDSHCGFCGSAFPAKLTVWPRTCLACSNVTYRNPLPVAVLIIPTDVGVVLIRRSLPDGRGKLALPGGFINLGESWQQAATREAFEETGILIAPAAVTHFRTVSAPDGTLLVFGASPRIVASDLPPFTPSDETADRVLTMESMELAFSLHSEVLRDYLSLTQV